MEDKIKPTALLVQSLATLSIAYLTSLIGFVFAWPSYTLANFQSNETVLSRPMTQLDVSLLGSLTNVGALVATPFCGYAVNAFGRKYSAMLVGVPFVVAWSMIALVNSVPMVLAAVAIGGFGAAGQTVCSVYIAEIVQDSIRGAMSSCCVSGFFLGLMFSYIIGGWLTYHQVVYVHLALSVLFILLMILLHESPVYLMQIGKEEEAAKSLAFYRRVDVHSKEVAVEIRKIKLQLDPTINKLLEVDDDLKSAEGLLQTSNEIRESVTPWKFLKNSESSQRALAAVLITMSSTIMMGCIVLQVYAEPLFKEAIPSMNANLCSIILALVFLLGSLACGVTVDRFGRKMLRYGLLVVCAALACASAVDYGSRLPDLQPAQQAEVDDMVNNILHWIQSLYQQKNRKARQYFGGRPERPRPFEPATYLPPTGYPAAGSRPTPSYEEGPSQSPASPTPSQPPYKPTIPEQALTPEQPTYQPSPPTYRPSYKPKPTQPPYQPSQPSRPSYQPTQPTEPTYQPSQPSVPSYQPSQPTQPSYQPSQPAYQPSQPSQPSYAPSQPTEQQPTQPEYQPGQPSYQPDQPSYQPSQPTYQPSQPSYQPSQPENSQPSQPVQPSYQPSQPTQPEVSYETNQEPDGSEQSGVGVNIETTAGTSTGSNVDASAQNPEVIPEDEDRHPPHIHAITVDCGKEMMTINIEFNKPYNGIIYSQDHFNEQECVYVRENSNQIRYSFTVSLNRCGTRFFSDFENEGQAYLENVLVLQNEPGIQEVWDHIRRVRCLWEGNLTKQLVSSLSVGMLNQITSNFSGDTAMARLDIQAGRGPFAQEANGLIKIGEIMTLVVSVTGDPGFDIFVRECIARDADSSHVVPLTDANGCVLKPKLFGAFQKTRDTGNTGATVIAYAYFNAFKFPDEMDLIIQCNVELCKTDCDACPTPGSTEPKRRRRDVIHVGNRTMEPSATISKGLRVVFAEDLPLEPSGFCVSPSAASWGACLILIGSLMSSLLVSYVFGKSRGMVKFS